MNYYEELKAIFSPFIFNLLISSDESAILGYLLIPSNKRELFLCWYSFISSECRVTGVPFIPGKRYINNLDEYRELTLRVGFKMNRVYYLERLINQFKNYES